MEYMSKPKTSLTYWLAKIETKHCDPTMSHFVSGPGGVCVAIDLLAYRAEVGNYKNRSRREQVSL